MRLNPKDVKFMEAYDYIQECFFQLFFYPLIFCGVGVILLGLLHLLNFLNFFIMNLSVFSVYIFLWWFWFGERRKRLHQGSE